jgi:hypothetical protein
MCIGMGIYPAKLPCVTRRHVLPRNAIHFMLSLPELRTLLERGIKGGNTDHQVMTIAHFPDGCQLLHDRLSELDLRRVPGGMVGSFADAASSAVFDAFRQQAARASRQTATAAAPQCFERGSCQHAVPCRRAAARTLARSATIRSDAH